MAQAPKPIEFSGHTNSVSQVAIAPGGDIGQWGLGRDGPAVESDRGPARLTLTGHTDWVLAIRFTPDGKTLLTASQRSVKAWDPRRAN
ncbi:MAG: hypothetical protein Ct9H300mP1_01990 [Planctomycetaceae bacterium]|nr:MAG: hypothetical protein Ct9H300mP1_01990 [Planctomycetaceae bacterium]